MKKINFLLAVHCHQPVGNFGYVIEEAYNKAYLPFLDTIESHPKIKLAIHLSGSLLDWLLNNRPEFLKKIKKLVERKQLEILTGGYYEPILSLVPERDAITQVGLLTEAIKDLFGYSPKGAWLTERVWEPRVASILNSAGVLFTILDDTHFRTALNMDSEILNFYITEENGKKLILFPASKRLRYYMPFKLPQESIEFLKDIASEKEESIVFADDIEKFGFWPKTYKWVYEEKWLERFLSLLEENSDWLNITNFSEYLDIHRPMERVYIPCSSYSEMLEWSGGFFRNFLTRYTEVNNMHKRMLYVSDEIDRIGQGFPRFRPSTSLGTGSGQARVKGQGSEIEKARHHLYKAQDNDAYWHGVFGGLYLNHLRESVYFNLIEAEKVLQNLSKKRFPEFETLDLDMDGNDEVIVRTKSLNFYFSPADGAKLFELDYLKRSINLINTITRRPEFYHKKLNYIKEGLSESPGPLSIHDILGAKEDDLERFLIYDQYRKACLIEHFLPKDIGAREFFRNEYTELGDFIDGDFKFKTGQNYIEFSRDGFVKLNETKAPILLKKSILLKDAPSYKIFYEIKNCSEVDLEFLFSAEFNLSINCPDLKNMQEQIDLNRLLLQDDWHNLKLIFYISSPCRLWSFFLETVSESESGLERTFQGTTLLFTWTLKIKSGAAWQVEIENVIDDAY